VSASHEDAKMIAIDLRGEDPLSGTTLWRLGECKRIADELPNMRIDTTEDYRRAVALEAFLVDTLRADATGMSAADRNTVARVQGALAGCIDANNRRFTTQDVVSLQLSRFLISPRARKLTMDDLHPLVCEARDRGVLRYGCDPKSGEHKLYVVGTYSLEVAETIAPSDPKRLVLCRPGMRHAIEVMAIRLSDVPSGQLKAWLHRMLPLGADWPRRRMGGKVGEVMWDKATLSKRIKPLLDGPYSRLPHETLVDAPDPWQVPMAEPAKTKRTSIVDVDALPMNEWQVHFIACLLPEDVRRRLERAGVRVRTRPAKGLTHLVTFDPPVAPGQPFDDSMLYEDFLKYVAARRKLEPTGTKFLSWVDFLHLFEARETAWESARFTVRGSLSQVFVGL